jgi:hypothetical protein
MIGVGRALACAARFPRTSALLRPVVLTSTGSEIEIGAVANEAAVTGVPGAEVSVSLPRSSDAASPVGRTSD